MRIWIHDGVYHALRSLHIGALTSLFSEVLSLRHLVAVNSPMIIFLESSDAKADIKGKHRYERKEVCYAPMSIYCKAQYFWIPSQSLKIAGNSR